MTKQFNKETLPFHCMALMALFPLMPFGILSIMTILFIIITVICYYKNLAENFKNRKKMLLINIAFFLLISVSLLYSENKGLGLNAIRRDLNLFIFPFVILLFFPKFKQPQFKILINFFLIASLILLVMFVSVILIYAIENSHLLTVFNYPYRNIIEGKTYLKITPTYLSLWFSFSILCMIYKFKESTNLFKKVLYTLGVMFFYIFIFLTSARMVFLALNVILIGLGIFFMKYNFKKKTLIFLSVLSVMSIISVCFIKTDLFKERYYKELFVKKIKTPKGRSPSSLSIRYGINSCNLLLLKESFLFGFGLGDVQERLNNCYKASYRSSVFKKVKFDSHNYYFYLLLSGGLIPLTAFLFMLIYNFRLAWFEKEYLHLGLLILIVFCCLTENILNRVHGSVFFAFFNTIFLLKNTKNI